MKFLLAKMIIIFFSLRLSEKSCSKIALKQALIER